MELNTKTKMFCGCAQRVRRRAEHPGVPRVPRPPRLDARDEREGRGERHPPRPRARLLHPRVQPLRAQELLLPRPREGLPDLAVRRADVLRGLARRRPRRRHGRDDRDRARAHRGGRGQEHPRRRHGRHPGREPLARRLQPRRRPARRDRHQAHHRDGAPDGRGGPRLRRDHPRHRQGARHLRRPDGAGVAARRRQPLAPRQGRPGRGSERHPLRQALGDQERQLAARHRALHPPRGRAPGRAAQRGQARRPGDAPLARGHQLHHARAAPRRRRRTTATSPSPTCCRSQPSREWVEELRATLPEHPAKQRARLQSSGGSATSRCAT